MPSLKALLTLASFLCLASPAIYAEASLDQPAEAVVSDACRAPDVSSFSPTGNLRIDEWRDDFAVRAVAAGHCWTSIEAILADLSPLSRFMGNATTAPSAGISDQAEFSKPIWEYIDDSVTAYRIENGRLKLQELSLLFDEIERRYRVDRAILAAIWAVETNYGGYIGTFDAANTLANMAAEGRRRTLAERELMALIQLLDAGEVRRQQLVSGWAGAMGHVQFMPTTFKAYAVDFDNDGNKDIWQNEADALASAARYIAASGYQFNQPWGVEVEAPAFFDWSLADGQDRRLSTWIKAGLQRADGQAFSVDTGRYAELWLPAGADGPKYLLLGNYDVFKAYNRSDAYALAVGLLSDRLAGRSAPLAAWPRDIEPLSKQQILELQAALNRLEYDAGIVDGVAGRNTRLALSRFQRDNGLRADGYPTPAALGYVLNAGAL
ncbi:MAG: lytic murein transglycosylase [Henriciella sp.]